MTPTDFPESNVTYKHPSDMDESQVRAIKAFQGQIQGGNCDGVDVVVVAWKPSEQEIEDIKNGKSVFLCMFGGLAPHYIGTSFNEVINVGQ